MFLRSLPTVAESKQVAPGELRVFLSEGTMVMASPHAKPALGTWRRHEGRLTITEEGLEYESVGEPVEILFRPADPVRE